MVLSSEILMSWLGSYLWALTRITALITAAPILGSRTIPVKVKLVIALAITILIVPLAPKGPAVDPLSVASLLVTINQVLIGALMGFSLQLVFAMFVIGGQVIAYQMGLGFSQMVDPGSGMQVPVVSQFYIIVLTLMFFSLDAHLVLLEILLSSFSLLPMGANLISVESFWSLIQWSSQMYAGAVRIALPAITSILLINLTFGVITRSAPQFNIFSIGFPVTILMGFFVIYMTLNTIAPHIQEQLDAAFGFLRYLIGAL